MERPRVFISYVRDDSDIVDRLVNDLVARGIDPWLDRRNLRAGDRWADVISKAIESHEFFIACISPAFTQRARTVMRDEILQAVAELRLRPRESRWFLPVLLGPTEIPDYPIGPHDNLRSFHAAKLYAGWDAGVAELVEVILGHRPPAPASAPPAGKSWSATLEAVLTGHARPVASVAFDPTGALLASGDAGKTIRLWNVSGNSERSCLTGHGGMPMLNDLTCVAFSSDGATLASTARADKNVQLWDVHRGTSAGQLSGSDKMLEGVTGVAFDRRGGIVAAAGRDSTVRVWNWADGSLQRRFPKWHLEGGVAVHPDGSILACPGEGASVALWDVASGRLIRQLGGRRTSDVCESVRFDGSGDVLASLHRHGTVHLWRVETGEALGTMDNDTGFRADRAGPSFSPDGTLLAVATGSRKTTVWDTRTRTVAVELSGHSKAIRAAAFHPGGQLIATGSSDRTVRVWRISPPG